MTDPIILLKSHIKGYTRKDGTFVAEHDDKRTAAAPAVTYPPHVKNWSDKAHHLEQIPADKRTPEEHAAYKKASKQSMYGKGQSAEYKAHLAAAKKGGAGAVKYDHPNVVGQAENLQGGDASKAHGMSFAGKKYSASGKTGKSMHDGTPVRHFREDTKDGADTGEHVWMDDKANVHADDTGSVKSLRERHEAHASKGAGDDGLDDVAKTKAAIKEARAGMYAAGKNKAEYERHEQRFEDAVDKLDKLQSGGSGHALPAGPVKHADSKAADKWMDDTIGKLKDAGYSHKGFTMNGSTWSHPKHGDLHIMHGVSNPADKSDDAIYSTVKHGDKPAAGKPKEKKPAGDAVSDESLKKHPMWSQSDFDYFKGKGYEPNEIKEIWDRDWKSGKTPVTHDKAPDVVGAITGRKK